MGMHAVTARSAGASVVTEPRASSRPRCARCSSARSISVGSSVVVPGAFLVVAGCWRAIQSPGGGPTQAAKPEAGRPETVREASGFRSCMSRMRAQSFLDRGENRCTGEAD